MKFFLSLFSVAMMFLLSANASAQVVEVEWITHNHGPDEPNRLMHGIQYLVVVTNPFNHSITVDLSDSQDILGLPSQYTIAANDMAQINFTPSSDQVFENTTGTVTGPYTFEGNLPGSSHTYEVVFGGDTDEDGDVDFQDFLTLSDNFGESGGWSDGDFDGDGEVGFSDYLILANNFGESI